MRQFSALVAALTASLAWAPNAQAIPAFARATGVNCFGCHTVYPELNETGELFRANGFQFTSAAGTHWTWSDTQSFIQSVPVAFRATEYFVGANDRSLSPDDPAYKRIATSFTPVEAALIFAGNLAPHFSIWADHDLGTSDAVNEGYLRVNSIGSDWLNLRAGSFELELPFTVAKTVNVFDYLIYDVADTAGLLNPFTFGEPQLGVEVSGHQGYAWRYALAAINGSNNALDNDGLRSAYARISAGPYKLHAGLAAIAGTAAIAPGVAGLANRYRASHFQRAEVDVDVHAGWWRIFGLYLLGRDEAALAANGKLNDTHYDGGFLQVEYLWNKPHLHFAARFDHVRSRTFQNLGVWSRSSEDAITPQIIFMMRPDIQLKSSLQLLRDPAGKRVNTAQVGVDWAVY